MQPPLENRRIGGGPKPTGFGPAQAAIFGCLFSVSCKRRCANPFGRPVLGSRTGGSTGEPQIADRAVLGVDRTLQPFQLRLQTFLAAHNGVQF